MLPLWKDNYSSFTKGSPAPAHSRFSLPKHKILSWLRPSLPFQLTPPFWAEGEVVRLLHRYVSQLVENTQGNTLRAVQQQKLFTSARLWDFAWWKTLYHRLGTSIPPPATLEEPAEALHWECLGTSMLPFPNGGQCIMSFSHASAHY